MLLLQPVWDQADGTSRPARQVQGETSVRSHTPQPLQADFRPGPALAPPLRFPGTQAPHPYSAFHLFSPTPRNPGGLVGMSPVKGAQGELGTGSQESFILVVIILTVGEMGRRNPDH